MVVKSQKSESISLGNFQVSHVWFNIPRNSKILSQSCN